MIKVTDRFYINANTNCYTLQEKTTVRDKNSKNYGKEVFKDLGYYTTIGSCLNGILKTTLREYISRNDVNTLKDLENKIKEANEYIQSLNLDK